MYHSFDLPVDGGGLDWRQGRQSRFTGRHCLFPWWVVEEAFTPLSICTEEGEENGRLGMGAYFGLAFRKAQYFGIKCPTCFWWMANSRMGHR